MSCASCREATTDSKVKVEENGKKAVFINTHRNEFVRVRVDGCLVRGATAADYVVARADVGHVVVELKGKDVGHACEQVVATARSLGACPTKPRAIAGLVVCTEYPKGIARKVRKLQEEFAKAFKGPIHVVARNEEYELEKVLSFSGPR